MKTKFTTKEYLQDIVNTCYDQYEEYEEDFIDKLTEEQARKMILEHIEFMVGTNGTDYLWFCELSAIKGLDLYEETGITKEQVKELLATY